MNLADVSCHRRAQRARRIDYFLNLENARIAQIAQIAWQIAPLHEQTEPAIEQSLRCCIDRQQDRASLSLSLSFNVRSH